MFGSENLRRIEPLLQTLRDVATDVGAKPAQVALAWLISLPKVGAIPGASSVDQLEFNVGAADIELSTQSRDALTDAARAFRPVSTLDLLQRTDPRKARPSLAGTRSHAVQVFSRPRRRCRSLLREEIRYAHSS